MIQKTDIEQYFNAEKQSSIIFLTIGIIAVLAALIFYFIIKSSFAKGVAIPFFIIGFIMTIVGITIFNRSDEDRKKNVYALDMNPKTLHQTELPRMKKVMQSFVVYKYTEYAIAFIGIGFYFFFYSKMKNPNFFKGLGLSLYIMAFIALVSDYYAEKRGDIYLKKLENHFKNEL